MSIYKSDREYYLAAIETLTKAVLADASVANNEEGERKSLDSLIYVSECYMRELMENNA
jgi:hypothetical protein